MSMYDDNDKDGLYYEIDEFLENHSLVEFLEIVFHFIKREVGE